MKNSFLCLYLFLSVSVYSQSRTENYISPEAATKKYGTLLKQSFYIFPETREHPIKWNDSLQVSWLDKDYTKNNFVLGVQPGEYFVYQVGVWAIKNELKNIQLSFSDLKTKNGKTISSLQVSCFNAGGIDYLGNPFTKKIDIQNGKMQPLWIDMDLSGVVKGAYYGTATVSANNKAQTIKIQLEVDGKEVQDYGFNEGKRLSRMYWLNSTLGINDDVTK